MRIALIAVVAALVGCSGKASSSPETGDPGSGGSGGTAAGGEPINCDTSLSFRLPGSAPSSESNFCLGKPAACDRPGTWLELFDATGQSLIVSLGCDYTFCSECQITGCPAVCTQSSPLPEEGIALQWDGVRLNAGQTCGDRGYSCVNPTCAAPGSYTARFCAYELPTGNDPNTFNVCETSAATTPTCVDVPFELPGMGVVQAVLEPDF